MSFTTASISSDWPSSVIRVANSLIDSNAVILVVDSDYYDWTFEKRMYSPISAVSLVVPAKTLIGSRGKACCVGSCVALRSQRAFFARLSMEQLSCASRGE